MLLEFQRQLGETVRAVAQKQFGVSPTSTSFQPTPKVDLGDLALSIAFELGKKLGRKPRDIASELSPLLSTLPGVARADVAGGGFINLFLDRNAFARELTAAVHDAKQRAEIPGRVIVEHTSINPNKAAHIGHVRNAVLGDTFVRLLRARGHRVLVQNYIDDTGVQVADVIVGFEHLEKKSLADVKAIDGRFDYICWDLYARVFDWYESDKERKKLQAATLHAIEKHEGETAALGEHVASRIVRAHLATMARLDIRYELLVHESDILRQQFWSKAFELLKSTGAIRFEEEGKAKGCWVLLMDRTASGDSGSVSTAPAVPGSGSASPHGPQADSLGQGPLTNDTRAANPGGSPRGDGSVSVPSRTQDDENKIIVRSNGTVTYTGKDIAYQLWKLGKLGLDFRYRRHEDHSEPHPLWTSTHGTSEPGAPPFGSGATLVYNVIDVGQSYPQRVVKAGVAAVAGDEAADGTRHLGYEKVVLSKATAKELGYEIEEGDTSGGAVKVSGRRGLGVKADDLIDALETKAAKEIETRDPQRPAEDRKAAAHAVAVGALRYFLLRFSRNKIITFDMEEALAFTGETGPYIQNSVVRARSILAKVAAEGRSIESLVARAIEGGFLSEWLKTPEGSIAWELFLAIARTDEIIEAACRTEEPSLMTRHAFQIAQAFHGYYQNPAHSVLRAESDDLRAVRVLVVDLFVRHVTSIAQLLGIPIPERM